MSFEKEIKKQYQPRKKISTDAITHSYMYRQITMTRDTDTIMSDMENVSHSVDTSTNNDVTLEEVLSWEAT